MKFESVRFEPVNPVCEAAMLTTGLARQSQQTCNTIMYYVVPSKPKRGQHLITNTD